MRKYFPAFLSVVLIITLFSFWSCNNSSADARVLKFNLEKGKTYDFEIVMDLDQEVMQQNNKIGFIASYALAVTEDDGKIKSLTGEYKDFKMSMKMMGQEINIDGAKKPVQLNEDSSQNNPLALLSNAFSGIIGKKFNLKVDETGNILEVTGFEELISGMIDAMNLTEEKKLMVTASLKDQFNAEKIRESFAPLFNIYPDKPIKTGDSWERSYKLKSGSAIKYSTKYTLKSFNGENALLNVNTRIESVSDTTASTILGDMKMSGTQTGVMTVNTKSGLVVSAELNQNIATTGNLKMKMIGKTKMKGKEQN